MLRSQSEDISTFNLLLHGFCVSEVEGLTEFEMQRLLSATLCPGDRHAEALELHPHTTPDIRVLILILVKNRFVTGVHCLRCICKHCARSLYICQVDVFHNNVNEASQQRPCLLEAVGRNGPHRGYSSSSAILSSRSGTAKVLQLAPTHAQQ